MELKVLEDVGFHGVMFLTRIHSMELKDLYTDPVTFSLDLMNPFNGIESSPVALQLSEQLLHRIHSMELKEHSVLRVLPDSIPFRVYLVSGI